MNQAKKNDDASETKAARIIFSALAAAALVILVLSCVPLLRLAPYAHGVIDDYAYGAPVHYTLQAGKGFRDVLGAVWENIRYTYVDWQGTFSSVFLFSLQPGAFSDGAYGVTAYVVLAVIVLPIFLALYTVRRIDRRGALFLGAVISFFTVQYLPFPDESIFWWNGAAHYLAFWCLGVWTALRQIKLTRREAADRRFYAAAALNCFLGFCVGGGNYCTALVFVMVSAALTACGLLPHSRAAAPMDRRIAAANAATALCAAAGLLISMAAPGNAARQAMYEPLASWSAIMLSFRRAGETLLAALDWKLLGALLLCIPVFLYATRKSGYTFRWPLLILLGSFCAFAALFTPPLYAMGDKELARRLQNLMWQAAVFFLFGNAFYLSGWVARRLALSEKPYSRRAAAALFAAGAVLFASVVLAQFRSSNAYLAYSDLKSPALETYVRERKEREEIYADKTILSPRFQPFSQTPRCFCPYGLTTWMSDLLIDGVPVSLPLYHGPATNYVELRSGLEFFDAQGHLSAPDFERCFHVRGNDYVSFRELCDLLGFSISYDAYCDTITVDTQGYTKWTGGT